MQTIAEYDNLKIPDYALPYLINADDSGLSVDDKQAIDSYMARYYQQAAEYNGHVNIGMDYEQESYFTWNPEFGLACNVVDCTILILK